MGNLCSAPKSKTGGGGYAVGTKSKTASGGYTVGYPTDKANGTASVPPSNPSSRAVTPSPRKPLSQTPGGYSLSPNGTSSAGKGSRGSTSSNTPTSAEERRRVMAAAVSSRQKQITPTRPSKGRNALYGDLGETHTTSGQNRPKSEWEIENAEALGSSKFDNRD